MAEYELGDDAMVGSLVRARVEAFEQEHPGWSVYVGDLRGMWDVRFTREAGGERVGRNSRASSRQGATVHRALRRAANTVPT